MKETVRTTYCVITIDTETDHQDKSYWIKSDPLTFDGVTEGIAKRLQPLFEKYGARPTYLLTYEVLQDAESIETLKNLSGGCELGTHLHGDYVPPSPRFKEIAGTRNDALACFYPPELEFAKIKTLTELFRAQIGREPASYRAGCFGAGGQTISNLGKLGYKVDTSVTPHMTWDYPMGKLDFQTAPEHPYFASEEDINKPGAGKILEVPATIRMRRKFGFLPRPDWLRPTLTKSNLLVKLIKRVLTEERDGPIVLNVMFHNMEVIPGKSPYVRTEGQSREFLSRLESILRFCREQGVHFVTLSELYEVYAKKD